MLVGYCRVSTFDQTTALQRDALRRAGCAEIYEDAGVSGVALRRPNLDRLLKRLKPGDVVVVWRLDRLGRSLPDLVRFVAQIKEAGAGFRSLTESIDTTTAAGILTFHVFCALADFERALLLERTSAGIKAAQARGKSCGRPFALTPEQVDLAIQRVNEHHGVADTAKLLGVSPRTLQRAMRRRNEPDKRRRRVA